jgi:hypothetical protein
VFCTDDLSSAFGTQVLDNRSSVGKVRLAAIGEPPSPDFTPVPSALRILDR